MHINIPETDPLEKPLEALQAKLNAEGEWKKLLETANDMLADEDEMVQRIQQRFTAPLVYLAAYNWLEQQEAPAEAVQQDAGPIAHEIGEMLYSAKIELTPYLRREIYTVTIPLAEMRRRGSQKL